MSFTIEFTFKKKSPLNVKFTLFPTNFMIIVLDP